MILPRDRYHRHRISPFQHLTQYNNCKKLYVHNLFVAEFRTFFMHFKSCVQLRFGICNCSCFQTLFALVSFVCSVVTSQAKIVVIFVEMQNCSQAMHEYDARAVDTVSQFYFVRYWNKSYS